MLDNGPTSHITALVNRRGIEGGDIYYSSQTMTPTEKRSLPLNGLVGRS